MKFTLSGLSEPSRRLVDIAFFGCCVGILGCPVAMASQEEPELVTDRPDQTESTAIVPAGRAQIEVGVVSLAEDDEGGVEVEATQLGATLVRVGLSERFELRLGWEGWLEEEATMGPDRASVDGAGDAFAGFKVELSEGEGASPAVALLAHTSVPVGDAAFSTDRYDSSARVSVSHDLAGDIGLGWNVGLESASSEDENGDHHTLATGIYTISAGFPAGERAGWFVEAFGEVGLSADGPPAHLLDAGVTYLVRPNLQLDAAAGIGLSAAATDWFAGIGVSMRLPR
jgi:hypothetical protein